MSARIVSGTANPPLARAIAAALETGMVPCEVKRFPDGELRPIVGHVRGEDVYVIQPTGPAVNEHLVELLLLLDACGRGGADRLTAVIPYFGYARQDRRGQMGEAIGARVVADVLVAAGAERLIVVDPHTAALEAMCGVPVEMLTAVHALAGALSSMAIPDEAVLVAPDLGAVKLAERYAALLRRPVAVVRKTRMTGETVRAEEIVGEVDGRPAVIVDDMISTGGTIEAAVGALLTHRVAPDIVVAATHGLFASDAADRLGRLPVRRLLVTDTVMPQPALDLSVQVEPVAALLAGAIRRLHRNDPLDELLRHT